MQTQTAITLLTVTIGLLTVIVMLLTAALCVIAIKMQHVTRSVQTMSDNVAKTAMLLSPLKLFGLLSDLASKKFSR